MSTFKAKSKEIVIAGYTHKIETQSLGKGDGTFKPIHQWGKSTVGGKKVLKSPLSFFMSGCSNQSGAVGVGLGVITNTQDVAYEGLSAYLVKGDSGQCTGVLVGTPEQQPGPCSCRFVIEKSGQSASLTENIAAPKELELAAHNAPLHQEPEEEEEEKKSWIEIELVGEDDQPVAGERYRITLPDGITVAQGTTDSKGLARITGIDPGTCQIMFPDLDKDAWEKKE
ncbi:hypothetical protein THIOM_005748 [Candidatus Thiomargarita nelsonii]|uniref:Uncharacterized protein n=1 Tax=Candidatus Thiomargarita nelsonii TaxID=1003181 RepID=A0A176RSF3_9GAMM|nr:hypothetical protein THIOM_005748 [Candidatus Thiomargarita nelsonii]